MIVEFTFQELFHANRLPSGRSAELHDDTTGLMVRLGELDDRTPEQQRVSQVIEILKTLDGEPLDGKTARIVVGDMNDADIAYLSAVWTASTNGWVLNTPGDTQCPYCYTPIVKIDLTGIKVRSADGPLPKYVELDIDPASVGVKCHKLVVMQPTWLMSRTRLPPKAWRDVSLMKLHRACRSIGMLSDEAQVTPTSLPPHMVMGWPSSAVRRALAVIDEMFPRIDDSMVIKCANEKCGRDLHIPFDSSGMEG